MGMRSRQTGASVLAILYIIVTLGLIVLVGIRAFPVYMNNHDVAKALDAVAQDPALQSAAPIAITRAFGRRLDAGYSVGVNADQLHIMNDGDTRILRIDYDVTRPFFANIDLLFHFKDSATMHAGSD